MKNLDLSIKVWPRGLPRNAELKGTGLFGAYYRLSSKCGIKLINQRVFSPIESLENARAELELLHKAQASRVTPKPYRLIEVHQGFEVVAGILMEHIEGLPLWQLSETQGSNYRNQLKVETRLCRRIKNTTGLKLCDLHGGNIIAILKPDGRVKAYKAIDFSPGFVAD